MADPNIAQLETAAAFLDAFASLDDGDVELMDRLAAMGVHEYRDRTQAPAANSAHPQHSFAQHSRRGWPASPVTPGMSHSVAAPAIVSAATAPVFHDVAVTPLPDALLEQYSHVKCKCFMGLLPEIHRAWFTIDNRLYVARARRPPRVFPFS